MTNILESGLHWTKVFSPYFSNESGGRLMNTIGTHGCKRKLSQNTKSKLKKLILIQEKFFKRAEAKFK